MAITWFDSATFDQTYTLSGSPTSFQLSALTIPDGVVTTGSGYLIVAVALSAIPGNVSDFISSDSLRLSVLIYDPALTLVHSDTLINVHNLTSPSSRVFVQGFSFAPLNLPTTGGFIYIAGWFTDATEQIQGSIAACVADTVWPASLSGESPNIDLFDDFTAFVSGSTTSPRTGTISLPVLPLLADDLLIAAAEIGNPQLSPAMSFASAANWTDIVSAVNDPGPCAVHNGLSIPISTDPFTSTVYASGTMPSGSLRLQGGVIIAPSGIGNASVTHVDVWVQDVSDVVIAHTGTQDIGTGGGTITVDLSFPASADHVVIVINSDIFPNIMKLSYQLVIWCSNQRSYAVAIGQYTSDLLAASCDWALTYTVPPAGTGLVGLVEAWAMQRNKIRSPSFAHIIG